MTANLEATVKRYDDMTKCLKRQCTTTAYTVAEKALNTLMQERMTKLNTQFMKKEVDTATYMKSVKELTDYKVKTLKTDKQLIGYYICGLNACAKDAAKLRESSINLLKESIETSSRFVKDNKGDKNKQDMVSYHKNTLISNRKRLKLLAKPFTPQTLIDLLQKSF